MDITVKQSVLSKELALADQIISKRPPFPILSSVLLTVAEDGNVTMAATDAEIGVVARMDAVVRQPGQRCIGVRKLFDLVRTLPDGDVQLGQAGDSAVLAGAGFRARLQSFAPEDFPKIPEQEGQAIRLPGEQLRSMIGRVRFAVSTNGGQYYLAGALLEIAKDSFRLVASDSYRLSYAEAGVKGQDGLPTPILPVKILDALSRVLDGYEGDVEYVATLNHLFFRAGSRLLFSRQIEGIFPTYRKMLPEPSKTRLVVDRRMLADALRRATMLDENRRTVFELAKNELTLNAKSAEVGDGAERLGVDYGGEPTRFALNAGYVLDFVESVGSERVELDLGDPRRLVWAPFGGTGMCLILPMRV